MSNAEINFYNFVKQYQSVLLTSETQFEWDFDIEAKTGKVSNATAWTINDLTVSKSKVKSKLNNFSSYSIEGFDDLFVLSNHWKNLLKSEVVRRCIECKNSVSIINAVIQAIRLLATICNNREPWLTTTSDIKTAYEKALSIQPSGVLAGRVLELSKIPFDVYLISDFSPIIYRVKREHKAAERRKTHVAISNLNDRLNSDKLPQAEEFSALVEILSSTPRREIDKILFPAIKLMLIMGLRLNEVCLIPTDWKYEEVEFDQNGNVVFDENGEILKTLYIKYYAEKQDKAELYEPRRVPVPHSFQWHVDEILSNVAELTFHLRQKLALHESSLNTKLYPNYDGRPDNISLIDFCASIGAIAPEDAKLQGIGHHYYMPRQRIILTYHVPIRRSRYKSDINWGSSVIDEYYPYEALEKAIVEHYKTKLSDISPAISIGSEVILKASETLFLLPRKAKAKESSSGWYYDWNRYLFVSKLSPQNIDKALCGNGDNENIFKIYLNKDLKLNSHSLRHLRSAELIRAQVSDMIHAKTMGRKSYAQNYEYDHRSVSESLKQFNIEDAILKAMPPKAFELLGKIATNQIGGSISKTFREVQLELGDEKAIEWLSAHADAMHLTPYGVCVANMITNPCPKHLQCFGGCSHFVTDKRPESRKMLETLRGRHIDSINIIKKNIDNGTFGEAHLRHAESLLNGIDTALSTIPGTKPFPEGEDLFVNVASPKGNTALDQPIRVEINNDKN